MEILSLQNFLKSDAEEVFDFESSAWGGVLQYKRATVGIKEKARRKARKGDVFDSAEFGCRVIAECLVFPGGQKVSDLDIDKLKEKDAAEMDRLLDAICGEAEKNPK